MNALTVPSGVAKCPTGISGLDDVLNGGFPRGRPTLVCGAAGCGKTLLGMQFLVRGALDHGENGAFIAFEEKPEDLRVNVSSLGYDLGDLEKQNKLSIDHIAIDPSEIIESGDYDLSGLFLRLGLAIDSVGAKRVVIDTLETLFGGLSNYGVIRSELRRLFDWLKDRGVTALITAERGEGTLTRHGLEEYVSDCVVILDHRVTGQISTRRLRVAKYRGSSHGTNEYPFLIGDDGFSVMPITSAGLTHAVSHDRVSTGIAGLDQMLGGQGVHVGTTVLLSGTAGAGKSSVAAHFAAAACARGDRASYFSFEESPEQLIRNMQSIRLDLKSPVESGLLRFISSRPTAHGVETHLAMIHRHVEQFKPKVVVLDPISNLVAGGAEQDAHSLLVRLIDYFKREQITVLLTSLTSGSHNTAIEQTDVAISSIVDTWLLVKTIELSGERNRGIYILKSRGTAHSNQIREFKITSQGIDLVEPYIGPEGVVTGSARLTLEAKERSAWALADAAIETKRRELDRIEATHREQLLRLKSQYDADLATLKQDLLALETARSVRVTDRDAMKQMRNGSAAAGAKGEQRP